MSEALNREYCELLWWKIEHDANGKAANPADIKPFHLDANLCIAELDRAFDRWQIHKQVGARYWIVGWIANDTAIRNYADEGATFTEAALKCLIAAHKRESEAV